GVLSRHIQYNQLEDAKLWAQKFARLFGPDDYYIELQDHGITLDTGLTQKQVNVELNAIAQELSLPTIVTNDIHYLNKEDAKVQDIMLCIGTGSRIDDNSRMRMQTDEFYLKTEEEMRAIFPEYPEALNNTVELAEKCNVNIEFGKIILPIFPLPEGDTNETLLRKEALKGLKERYGDPLPQEVLDRFEHEYDIITTKGFAAYFLIVQGFTKWAKSQGIGVGPGRGSAAGSIISYALDITSFDPLENGLIFERFLSPERTEMPDIDMDFDDERRLDVIDYVRKAYGKEKVAHVITYSTIKAKQAINDAARVLDQPIYLAQKLSKMISSSPGVTLAEVLKKGDRHPEFYNPDFSDAYEQDPNSKEIIDAALAIEGLTRGEGVHASAVIICRDPIYDHVPTKIDTKGGVEITQYDGTTVADLGLLKMDFLGLRTLTVLSKAKQNIKLSQGIDIDEKAMFVKTREEDAAVFDLFLTGHTAGVFQVESQGMTALLKKMKPSEYKHIVAVLALYRPGPLNAGMVDDYVDRMSGRKTVEYYDERLRPILEDTYGTIVYQEQVMQISVTMSGFTLGESDRLRKAVAKKKLALMREVIQKWADGAEETMEEHWLNGAVRNGYSRAIAQKIWDDVLAFAEYAFNKSHSAAYGILTMETAYLKAHYPSEYMAAVLSSYMGKSEKIVHYIGACRQEGIEILPPDINISRSDFTPDGDKVRFGLSGLRGVGENAVSVIEKERDENGPFKNLHDFVERVDAKVVTRKVVEALIKSGAFDSTGYTRKQLYGFISKDNPNNILDAAQKRQKDKSAGQVSMFDMFGDDPDIGFSLEIPAPNNIEWDRPIKLAEERRILGIYVSDHPLRPYEYALSNARDYTLSDVFVEDETSGEMLIKDGATHWFAGMVTKVTKKATQAGKLMAIMSIEDMEGEMDAVLFPSVYDKARKILEANDDFAADESQNIFVRIKAKLERSDRGDQLIVYELEELVFTEENNKPHVLELQISKEHLKPELMVKLSEIFKSHPGNDHIELIIHGDDSERTCIEVPQKVSAKDYVLRAECGDILGSHAYVKYC
ncbi:MAG: DNA polymerase III subunit alpha, partial [Coriobacteriia bacterium]|nr:DNA polymerase III subunit alpha [Coriobacteriia bacterium]